MQTPEYRRLVRLAASYNRKARRFGVRGAVSADDLLFIEETIRECAYCGISLEAGHGSFDHIVPFKSHGPNEVANITRCCLTCQRKKFTKTPEEFAAHAALTVACVVCGNEFQPRWAEYQRGMARTCSRSCSGRLRWQR